MRHELATLLLGPILLRQGAAVRKSITLLAEPPGERQGRSGTGPSLRVLIIGDSAGAGVGATSQADALVGRVATELAGSRTVIWRVAAHSGATVRLTLRYLQQLEAEPWDWVVASLGVNDVVAGTSPHAWLASLDALRDLLRTRFGAPRILISGLPPMHLFPALPQPLRWYLGARAGDLDRALAGWTARYADCARLETTFSRDPALMAADGFHPGPGLYRLWGRAVANHIRSRSVVPE